MQGYSTREAAKKLGISFASINRYIAQKKIPVPALIEIGSTSARLWSDRDIERVRALLPKIANGRKTRYHKKHSALSSQQSAKSKTKQPQPSTAVPRKPHKKK